MTRGRFSMVSPSGTGHPRRRPAGAKISSKLHPAGVERGTLRRPIEEGLMATTGTKLSRAAEIRQRLDYPIVDIDGHILEVMPVFAEYIRETQGAKVADAFEGSTAYRRFSSP